MSARRHFTYNIMFYCLNSNLIRIALYLCDGINTTTGFTWRSQKAIAEKLGISLDTIQRHCKVIDKLGFFQRQLVTRRQLIDLCHASGWTELGDHKFEWKLYIHRINWDHPVWQANHTDDQLNQIILSTTVDN